MGIKWVLIAFLWTSNGGSEMINPMPVFENQQKCHEARDYLIDTYHDRRKGRAVIATCEPLWKVKKSMKGAGIEFELLLD